MAGREAPVLVLAADAGKNGSIRLLWTGSRAGKQGLLILALGNASGILLLAQLMQSIKNLEETNPLNMRWQLLPLNLCFLSDWHQEAALPSGILEETSLIAMESLLRLHEKMTARALQACLRP
ncbi:hypothetical protein JRQ81_014426 [Phrynocephalus forsythii]|uniref:Uncharacterized protein n=1 Tax=Phrynocephalus forsythii TaxID=171643 RepID=A0A9Q0XXM7_9SAUR|nr:hypothetical protein JRQ81_014426 [Phrynocephalus forsythii]